jgi:hypothetical protein
MSWFSKNKLLVIINVLSTNVVGNADKQSGFSAHQQTKAKEKEHYLLSVL